MKKLYSLNFMTFIVITLAIYASYYFMLQDPYCSISSIIAHTHTLNDHQHLLILGLLPIYIGTMIFGAFIIGMYASTALKHWYQRVKKAEIYPEKKWA